MTLKSTRRLRASEIDHIIKLWHEGYSVPEISENVGVSRFAVRKYIKREEFKEQQKYPRKSVSELEEPEELR